MFWKKKLTPYQRLSKESGLRRTPLKGRELRRVQRELEQIKRDDPDYYQALVKAKRELVEIAQAMYPPEEEHRRLLATERPSDQPIYGRGAAVTGRSDTLKSSMPFGSRPGQSTPVRSSLARRGIACVEAVARGVYQYLQWKVVTFRDALVPTTIGGKRAVAKFALGAVAVGAILLISQARTAGQTVQDMDFISLDQSIAGPIGIVLVKRRWAGGAAFVDVSAVDCIDSNASSCLPPQVHYILTLLNDEDSVLAAVPFGVGGDSVKFRMSLAEYSSIRRTETELAP